MSAAPRSLRLREGGSLLVVGWTEGDCALSAEFLRVHSPSAEVRGHGGGEGLVVGGKRAVTIRGVDPVGRYAVRLRFSDGHDSGLYGWALLAHFCSEQPRLWARYLERLAEHGMSRDADDNVVPLNALR